MDLLKDITRELRGGNDENADGGQSRTTPTARGDSGRRDAAEGATDRSSTTGESTSDDSSADRLGDSADRPGTPSEQAEGPSGQPAESADHSPEEVHVCSFCETEFDASDSVCPDCGAEIVLRGDR